MSAVLVLRCLGNPLVLDASGAQVRFRTRKHLALLVRLALEPGRKLTRNHLVELLWPTAPARLASHSLAQAISVLKVRIKRENLVTQRATVTLAEGAVDCDVLHLDTCDVEIRGPFLDGFEIPDSRAFEDWKDEWHARLAPRVRDCLVKQMDAGRRIGDFPGVERHAQVLYDLDPLSEDAVRGVMEARAWVGDRTNALKTFAQFESRVADELGAKPSADLARMATLLRDGLRRPGLRVPAPGLGRAEKRFEAEILIGREKEFAALYDVWLEARRRAPRFVVLTADPGVGKTTLCNAFASSCQMEGAVVARAQAYDAERELPFGVLGELVRQLTIQRAIGGADPEALSELSRVTGDIFAAFPGVPKPVEWSAEIAPLRLADAFLKAVVAAAEESPVVLVVDDIHAADNASAAILHMVARKITNTRMLLILAGRSAELRSSAAPAALTSDAALEGLRPIELEPLSPEASAQLVARLAADAVTQRGEPPAERILHASRGNPLAIELLTREWAVHGPESLLRDLEALDTLPMPALGIPRAIKTVFERQAQRLDTRTRAVLDLAAVLGRRLADLALYDAANLTAGQAVEGLSRLRDEGLLREVQGYLEFRNELIRGQAYYAVAAPARSHLHKRVAELLAGRPESPRLEVAWHFLRAGQPNQATPYALDGAEAAIGIGAPSEAEQVLGALLQSQIGAPGDRHRAQILLARALLDQSKANLAMPILESLERAELPLKEHAQVAQMQASAEYLVNREFGHRHSVAAERALAAARRVGDPELIVNSLFEQARAGLELGDEQRVRSVKDEVETLLADPVFAAQPMAHLTRAYCSHYFYDAPAARLSLASTISLLSTSTRLPHVQSAYSGLGVVHFLLCEFDKAEDALRRALKLAQKLGDESRASAVMANLAGVEAARGNYWRAIELGEASIATGMRAHDQPFLVAAHGNLIDAHLLSGQRELAAHYERLAREWVAKDRSWYSRIWVLADSASLALCLGNTPLVMRLIHEIDELVGSRELAIPKAGLLAKLHVFRAAHEDGTDKAFATVAKYEERFREKCPYFFLDVLAARAWLEKRATGEVRIETQRDLGLFEALGARGIRDLLVAQGFLT